MQAEIIQFPVTMAEHLRNQLGQSAVPCEISNRWLQMDEQSSLIGKTELLNLSVMTRDQDNNPRKICNLVVTRESILRALQSIEPRMYK